MSLYQKIEQPYDVKFATENDVCDYCLKEYMKELFDEGKEYDPVRCRENLKNRLTNQKIYKLGGAYSVTICKDHLKKIYEAMGCNEETEGVTE